MIRKNVKKLKLDSVSAAFSYISGCLRRHFRRFAGKTYYHMHNRVKSRCFTSFYRVVEHRKGISPANSFRCFFVYGLKPKLHPYRLYFVKARKKLNNLRRKAVRPCSHRNCGNIRVGYRFTEKRVQPLRRRICACIALKIGYISAGRVLFFHAALCEFNLFGNGRAFSLCKASASAQAEGTAAAAESSVSVRAGKTAVQSQLIDFFAELFAKLVV